MRDVQHGGCTLWARNRVQSEHMRTVNREPIVMPQPATPSPSLMRRSRPAMLGPTPYIRRPNPSEIEQNRTSPNRLGGPAGPINAERTRKNLKKPECSGHLISPRTPTFRRTKTAKTAPKLTKTIHPDFTIPCKTLGIRPIRRAAEKNPATLSTLEPRPCQT